MALKWIKPYSRKKLPIMRHEDQFLTNGEWIITTQVVQSYPSNLEVMSINPDRLIPPNQDFIRATPTIELLDFSSERGDNYLIRKVKLEVTDKIVWINNDYYKMFSNSYFSLTWHFMFPKDCFVIMNGDQFLGALSPLRLKGEYAFYGEEFIS